MTTSLLHQTLYRWGTTGRLGDLDDAGLCPVASSLDPSSTGELRRWHDVVEPWLRLGDRGVAEPSFFYAAFPAGTAAAGEAVLIRRVQPGDARTATAHLLFGAAGVLTPRLALELRDWTWAPAHLPGRAPMVNPNSLISYRSGLSDAARAPALRKPLVTLMSRVLAGPGAIEAPVTGDTMALLWAVDDICTVLGSGLRDWDDWRVAFETNDERPWSADPPGMFLRFRRGMPLPAAEPSTRAAALAIVRQYLTGGTNGLRDLRNSAGLNELDTMAARVDRLIAAAPPSAAPAPPPGSAGPAPAPPPPQGRGPARASATGTFRASAPSSTTGKGEQVSCPICLGRLDWGGLPLYTYDRGLNQYTELNVPKGANREQRARMMRTASVRCPNPGDTMTAHYLPAGYGQYGSPAVYGFIGGTTSGKTHLVAAMVAAIERGELGGYGITAQPVDLDRHQAFLRDMVRPLFTESTWLTPTREGEVAFADAFVVSGGGRPRAVALFDVAGSELSNVGDAKRFLDIADGLVFVADPTRFGPGSLGDPSFNTVLSLLRASGRLPRVSAAIVLNKADLFKFDDPIAHWLARDSAVLDAAEVLEESADVFGYMRQRDAEAWTRPYLECDRATLHVASATGTDAVERGVRPQRVLRPLVALMAMTGLLTSAEAKDIGI
ncbi:hypothetical protein [Actinomadura decatromicini]|uniref:Uncharacterized protein n=1 Tax=Actinomadura decatromicini TaxID=2604572 RepID=A0A5D3FXU4_9ACTN|nr:hypothetical protein [Actinomadura decatromicini]TYK52530.1 hypothetical protein FXF68_01785 [Actinomadura decatromicini]